MRILNRGLGRAVYCSASQALQGVARHLGPELIHERTWQRLLDFAARYPALGQTQYLGIRLGHDDSGQVDLLISAATNWDRESLERKLSAYPANDVPLGPLRRFLAAWMSKASVLHDGVPVTWLEFDDIESNPGPLGSIGVCLAPAYLDPHAALPRQASVDVLAVVFESLRAIRGEMPTSHERASFEKCFEHLPALARWLHLSVKVSRSPAELELHGLIPREELVPYLVQLGWAGDSSAVSSSIDRYCMPDQTGGLLSVDLPITGMFNAETAGLGVVFGQHHLRIGSDRDPRRAALLEALVRAGLCTASERAALLKWPGKELVPLPEQRPGGPDAAWVRCWHDIKIVHRPKRSPMAKAYLGFAAQPARRPWTDREN